MSNHSSFSRRRFAKYSALGLTALMTANTKSVSASARGIHPIRLGGPLFEKYESPQEWVAAVKRAGFSAAYCPVNANQSDDVIQSYEQEAKRNNIIIAEVGAWSNPISPNDEERKKALSKCTTQLALADRIGANCCVNISGSRNENNWAGPHEDNLTKETFDLIVETIRKIIDDVKPKRTFFTLETMPWGYPDSPDSYVELLHAIDRKHFAVHLDPVNLVCSPQRYYNNGSLIRECFDKLGPYLKSCHAKDILLSEKLTTHLDEVRPGLGNLDYAVFLQELSARQDIPLMLEHLSSAEEYAQAAIHIRKVGKKEGIPFV